MRRKTSWWRNLGGLLVACVLAVLVAAPVSSAVCLCDDGPIERVASAVQTVQADHGQGDAPCKAVCCVSGHCHHAGSLFEAPVPALAAPVPTVAEHAAAPALVLASHTPSPLDHPPRA